MERTCKLCGKTFAVNAQAAKELGWGPGDGPKACEECREARYRRVIEDLEKRVRDAADNWVDG